mgnify:CR=1 FL=1
MFGRKATECCIALELERLHQVGSCCVPTATKGVLQDRVGYVQRDVQHLGYIVDATGADERVFIEDLAAHFAKMVLHNMACVVPDREVSAQLAYSAAQGLLRGVTEHLALMDPEELLIEQERTH